MCLGCCRLLPLMLFIIVPFAANGTSIRFCFYIGSNTWFSFCLPLPNYKIFHFVGTAQCSWQDQVLVITYYLFAVEINAGEVKWFYRLSKTARHPSDGKLLSKLVSSTAHGSELSDPCVSFAFQRKDGTLQMECVLVSLIWIDWDITKSNSIEIQEEGEINIQIFTFYRRFFSLLLFEST